MKKYWERIRVQTKAPEYLEKVQLANGEIIYWSIDRIDGMFYMNVWEGQHFWMAPGRATYESAKTDLQSFLESYCPA